MSERLVIIDGTWGTSSELDPTKHRFVGVFRPPRPLIVRNDELQPCPHCGMGNWRQHDSDACYDAGHYDQPQYRTIRWFSDEQAPIEPTGRR